jgi:hypothetical protein
VRAIYRPAIHVTAQSHPLLGSLTPGDNGLNTAEIREWLGEREKKVIRQGFEELILNLFELLAELTGEAIVNKLTAKSNDIGSFFLRVSVSPCLRASV